MYIVNVLPLRTSADVAISSLDMSNGVAVNSMPIKVSANVGFGVLLVTENKAGGAGDVDIYVEYSDDDATPTNWNKAYTTSSGALTVDANIVTTLQNVTRRIVFDIRMARWVRFVFDPDADSTVTAKFSYQEEV